MTHTATKTLRVVGGLIVRGDTFLLAQRRLDDASWPGTWEFPGGKVDLGENDKDALERELEEELDVEVEVGRQFIRVQHDLGDARLLDFRVYLCTLDDGEPTPVECAAVRWVTLAEAQDLATPPADQPVLQRIAEQGLA